MSSIFWNYLEIPTPVILSNPLNCRNAYGAVSNLKAVTVSIKNTLNDFKQLNLEAAALSRLIYRTKYKLRQEKSFKTLQMINRCLTNYLSLHLPFTVNAIQDTLVDDRGPSRQMLEWALVRLLSVAHLFHRVYSLCTQAAGHLFVRMKLVQMYELTFFAVAVISRIWTYAQFIVRKACEWYNSLYQFLDKLQSSPHPWLPEGCVLPADVAVTLGNPVYLNLKSVSKPDELISQLNASVSETEKVQINGNLPSFEVDDIGETISREGTRENSVIEQEIEELSSHMSRNKKGSKRKHENNQKVNSQLSKQPLERRSREATKENSVIEQEIEDLTLQISKNKKGSKRIHENGQEGNNQVNKQSCERREPVQKKHKGTKEDCKPAPKPSSTSYSHSAKSIRSSKDLLKFLEVETALRNVSTNAELTQQPLMKNCDKLQWSMIEKFMKKQIKLLSKSETFGNIEQQEKLLKRVRKNIKNWISS